MRCDVFFLYIILLHLVIVDNLSSFVWILPLKTKSAEAVEKCFAALFPIRSPTILTSDSGTEYTNNTIGSLCKQFDVVQHYAPPPLKASVNYTLIYLKTYAIYYIDFQTAELYVKLIKRKIHRHFQLNSTRRYIDILQDLVYSLNTRYVHSIGMAPIEVTIYNQELVFKRRYSHLENVEEDKPKYKIGDKVRIRLIKNGFIKGYLPNYSTNIYTVNNVSVVPPIFMYKLLDNENDPINGRWNQHEIIKALDDS